MDLTTLTAWLRAHYEQLKTARDDGQSTAEVALIVAGLLVAAGLVVLAVKSKITEKIGIINGA